MATKCRSNRTSLCRRTEVSSIHLTKLLGLLLSTAGVFCVAGVSYAENAPATVAEVENYLEQADAVRSSDPTRFADLVAKLESVRLKASATQKQRIEYLQIYEQAVYRDEFAPAISKARALYKKASDPNLKFRTGTLIANLSGYQRDFGVGLRYLEQSLALRNKVTNRQFRHDGIATAALLYNELGQYNLALRYSKEVLADKPNPRLQCAAGHVRLQASYSLGKSIPDDAAFVKAAEQCSAAKEAIGANLVRATLARKWASSGQVDKSISLLEESLPEVLGTRYPRLIAEIRSILAELKLAKGDLVGAQMQAQLTVDLGEAILSTQALVTAYNVLYQVAEKNNQTVDALLLYKRYSDAERARQSDVKARELAYEIVRHETQQQSQQIELLKRNNQVLRLQQTLERESAQKARLAMVFLMLVLAGIIFWAVQIKRHQTQLQRLAQTDTLTGLGNRYYFTQKSERALVDAAHAGEPAALVMFDLDHFKAINDTYGHGAGDWVLKQVGKTCSSHCRKVDYLGRIGGEEFAVLLRGFDLTAAARMAENCRSQLAQIDTRECGYSFVVTASFGVSSTAQSGYDLSRLLSHADQMLYRAKNEGRNRVCAYTTDMASDARSHKRSPALSVVNN